MKNRLLGTVALLSATTLIVSGCSLLGSSSSLSKTCEEGLDRVSTEFVQTLENVYDDPFAESSIDALESITEIVEKNCQEDDQNVVLSTLISNIDSKASNVPDENKQNFVFVGLNGICDIARDEEAFNPTQEVKDTCTKAKEKSRDFDTTDFGSGFGSGSTIEETGGSDYDSIFGPDGPAIDGVDTDLSFPGDDDTEISGGSIAPYELTYVLEGVGTTSVSYVDRYGEFQFGSVSLPWEYRATSTEDYVSLSGTGDSEGQLSCAIYVDGIEVDKFVDSGSEPSVSCYHFFD